MYKEIKGWSFCITANSGENSNLKETLDSIINEFNGNSNFEIVIIGNSNYDLMHKNIRSYNLKSEYFFSLGISKNRISEFIKNRKFKTFFFKTGAISLKKNLAAKYAKYDKICILHDYVNLCSGWLKGYDKFGYNWNVCQNIILDKNRIRDKDWLILDHPKLISQPKLFYANIFFDNKKFAQCQLP
ncbi:hypothetical protein N8340_02165 [Flavobacteriaceae bacterium]|nr:hypothetical protein [Flavobacteriaceae bacterium]